MMPIVLKMSYHTPLHMFFHKSEERSILSISTMGTGILHHDYLLFIALKAVALIRDKHYVEFNNVIEH